MIYNDSEAIIDNCLFFDNEATKDGGAIEVWESAPPYFINCTFVNNHAGRSGGVIDVYYSLPTLTNCILWENTADVEGNQVNIDNVTAGLNIYHCDVQEGVAGFSGYPNNGEIKNMLEINPEFFLSGEYPYAIDTTSLCMDYGTLDTLYLPDGWVCPCVDLADTLRIQDDYIDLGAYEARQLLITGTNESYIKQMCNLSIYPNPTTDNFTLAYQLRETGTVNIYLYSITGKKIEIVSNKVTLTGEHFQNIDITALPSGYYMLKLQMGDEVITKKVVKL